MQGLYYVGFMYQLDLCGLDIDVLGLEDRDVGCLGEYVMRRAISNLGGVGGKLFVELVICDPYSRGI